MSQFDYLTISKKSEGLYKEKGSKFISFAFPATSVDDCKKELDNLKNEFSDARHICYAYRLGANHKTYRANDDGEPSNTAGAPILSQIKSNNLTNVLIAVVRYFGGTKLGASGLITAYKVAAKDAISNSIIIDKVEQEIIALKIEFIEMGKILNQLKKETEIEILNTNMTDCCEVTISVDKNEAERFKNIFLVYL